MEDMHMSRFNVNIKLKADEYKQLKDSGKIVQMHTVVDTNTQQVSVVWVNITGPNRKPKS